MSQASHNQILPSPDDILLWISVFHLFILNVVSSQSRIERLKYKMQNTYACWSFRS